MEVISQTLALSYAGAGWIGRHRMDALADEGLATPVAVAEPDETLWEQVRSKYSDAKRSADFGELLSVPADGVVIATPSALHAAQAIAALERGLPVFCQKPLGTNLAEANAVVEAARRNDRLLGMDLSYRFTCFAKVRDLVRSGEIGEVYAADLVFHNAYGPGKGWYYNPGLSGGGCVIDLGVHLIDLAMWTLGFPGIDKVRSRLFAKGKPLSADRSTVEDFAQVMLTTRDGTALNMSCSWHASAGRDAVIGARFYGTKGGACFRNLNGSFYDFTAEWFRGTSTETLALPPDAWGGRAIQDWARRLMSSPRFDEQAAEFVSVAEILERIYQEHDL